jgi:hypothetical protein
MPSFIHTPYSSTLCVPKGTHQFSLVFSTRDGEPAEEPEPPFFSLKSLSPSLFGRFTTGAQALFSFSISFLSSRKRTTKRGKKAWRGKIATKIKQDLYLVEGAGSTFMNSRWRLTMT